MDKELDYIIIIGSARLIKLLLLASMRDSFGASSRHLEPYRIWDTFEITKGKDQWE